VNTLPADEPSSLYSLRKGSGRSRIMTSDLNHFSETQIEVRFYP
jgi:hypothetical protein